MDANDVLMWLVGLSAAWPLVSLVRAARAEVGLIAISLTLLLALVIGSRAFPGQAGFVAGGLWLIWVLVPAVGARHVQRLAAQERFGPAESWSRFLRWLHPGDGWWSQPTLLRGMALAAKGQKQRGLLLISTLRDESTPFGRLATCWWYRIQGRWSDLLAWIQTYETHRAFCDDANVRVARLRALAEVGRTACWIRRLEDDLRILDQRHAESHARQARLIALAFSGRVDATRQQLDGPMRALSPAARTFWLATALQACGRRDEANALMAGCPEHAWSLFRSALEQRRRHPVRPWDGSPADRAALDALEQGMADELAYDEVVGTGWMASGGPWITWGLAAAMLLLYAITALAGGSTDPLVLHRWGALVGVDFWRGEVWRLGSALFLHWGPLHLALNLGALLVMGPWLERRLGMFRFAAVFGAAGLGAGAVVLGLEGAGWLIPRMIVGASGSLLGLIGALAALLWADWRRAASRSAGRWLKFVGLLLVIQVVVDAFTPAICLTAHLAGIAIGFVMGTVLWKHPR